MPDPIPTEQRAAIARQQRAKLIQLIHIAKGQLGMDEDTYRSLLRHEGQADSTDRMTLAQLETVLRRMKDLGFQVRAPKSPRTAAPQRPLAQAPQDRKIRALWLDLHGMGVVRNADEAALAAFVQRMTGVAALQWLTTEQASAVIEHLKRWQQRSARLAAKDGQESAP